MHTHLSVEASELTPALPGPTPPGLLHLHSLLILQLQGLQLLNDTGATVEATQWRQIDIQDFFLLFFLLKSLHTW